MKLDKKDILIIYLLSKNSRVPNNYISKKLKISNETVKNRIKKLEKNGIIKAYKTNINYKKLGFLEYDIYLKFKNYNQKELKGIIKIICNNKYVTWVGTCFGRYDLRVSIIVKNTYEINNFLKDVKNKTSKYFLDYKILSLIEKYKIEQEKIISEFFKIDKKEFSKIVDLNINKKNNIYEENLNKKKVTILKLDDTEKAIIKILNKNPKTHIINISNELKLTPEACSYRIKELTKKNIITSFSAILDGNKLNKIWAVFLFKVQNEEPNELKKFILSENNVSSFVNLLGDWNYSVTVFANNVKEIHTILMNFRNKFPEIIKEYELIILFETFKYPSIPEIIFE
jgi:Lrp/AsnC family leucine-responsive transcriptional regulator